MPTDATPLLESQQQRVQVPLPTAQLFALWVSRLTDPISYTQIFPYINQFLLVLHVTEDISKVGFYSGLVESTFAVTQTLSTYSWARLSDVVGRRPIILFGASGLAVVTILLGFCTSLTQIIIVRAVAGFLAGNLAVFHAILAEITHESNQAVAYPIYSSSWPLGAVIGPLIGGSLSNLGTKYPNIWGYDFVLAHPYFMPNFVCTVLVLLGLSLAYVFLEEVQRSPSKRPGSFNRAEIVQSTPYGVRNLLANPKMRAVTASSFMLAFVGAAFDVVFVLFCYTPIQQGGLSFSVDKIGLALALSGCILVVFQLIFMPMLLRRIKAANLYNYCIRMWPLTFLLMPSLNLILRRGYNPEIDDPATNILLWLSMTFLLVCSRIAALAYGTQMILVKDIAPTTALGEANGLVQVAMGAARCFSPAFISSIFALSIDNNVLGGYPIWVAVMLVVCLGSCYLSEQLIEMKGADKES
ncbi:MFS domain-containing protein [Mycena indigotica]|uniref:MFS domain-containing protein n=1 Tax=Mycena indigotica TaxID=2126181 RepID=A0A8H6S980_9AGAR|nr:MFS domain-containing protein [Mycena indigotica]KAF7295325.1 MFS domain-containing protein [Mycena indigotica]